MSVKNVKLPAKYSAQDVANYFIWKAKKEGKPITNKKLQKLLYYAQAWHLVFNEGKPLFQDDIEAWVHGPVVRAVYDFFKKAGFNPISQKKVSNPFDDDKTSFLDQVWNIYGGYDADYLEMLTHQEQPWQEARQNLQSNQRSSAIISIESMKNFYSKLANAS